MSKHATEASEGSRASLDIIEALERDQPMFHWGGTRRWDTAPETLRQIRNRVKEGMRTLETGCGASTVVFAAAGAHHTVISPTREEQQRVRDYLEAKSIDASRVSFVVGFSDDVLPGLCGDPNRLANWETWYADHRDRLAYVESSELFRGGTERVFDYVFIDGAHSFPCPVIDWYFSARALKIGGRMLVDDIPIPAVAVLHRYMSADPRWHSAGVFDNRAAAFDLVAEPAAEDWTLQPFNRRAFFGHIPLYQRAYFTFSSEAARGKRVLGDKWPELRRWKQRWIGKSRR